MRDDELEIWRRQWQGQPNEVVDLIRRVERETIAMRLGQRALLAPLAVAAASTVVVVVLRSGWGILFVAGLWLIMGLTGRFVKRNQQGTWTPDAETTTAYLELSIKRCQSGERDFRIGRWVAVLVPAYVFIGVSGFLKSGGALKGAVDYVILGATFLYTIVLIGLLMFVLRRNAKKRRAELDYLLDLQRRLTMTR